MDTNRKSLIAFLFLLLSFSVFGQKNEKRLALVIGNADYNNGANLKNPVNDANLMASTLEDLGFDVIKYANTSKARMEAAIYEFSKQLPDYGVALFYYAGHGILIDGKNYLVPVDAKMESQLSVDFETINMEMLVKQFEAFKENINIVILDACRYNPYRSWSKGMDRGFKPVPAPSGTIVAYASGMGEGASDGYGENGLYTSKLVEQLKVPQRIEDVFIKTRIAVRKESENSQNPQEWSQLNGEFYFQKDDSRRSQGPAPVITSVADNVDIGKIELVSEIKGQLFVDDRFVGLVNPAQKVEIQSVAAGYRNLELVGLKTWKKQVFIEKDAVNSIEITFTEDDKEYMQNLDYKIQLGVSVENLLIQGHSIDELIRAGMNAEEFYGTKYAGGRIFHIDPNDRTALIAGFKDLQDEVGVTWDAAKDLAFSSKDEGYDDWRLPSKDQLSLMYLNLKKNNDGNFMNGVYWSSSGGDRASMAWRQDFKEGYQYQNYTYLKYYVRAIREVSIVLEGESDMEITVD